MFKTSFIQLVLIKYRESAFPLHFSIFSLFYVSGPQALYVNPSCLKCISGINLFPANKNVLSISIILYLVLSCFTNNLNKRGRTKGLSLEGCFFSKVLNNPLASCCLIIFYFLPSHNVHFDKTIILPFFVVETFGFLLTVFFLHAEQYDKTVL